MISQRKLLTVFTYDPATGQLLWKERHVREFSDKRAWATWNARFAGKVAGCQKASGYRHISIDGKFYQAHRLVWLLMRGESPDGHIDHVTGDKSDNRIENLRVVSDAVNARNRPRQRNNSSGHNGVSPRGAGRWYAYIRINRKMRSLGIYADKASAVAARMAAERELGFHPNHGRAE